MGGAGWLAVVEKVNEGGRSCERGPKKDGFVAPILVMH